jgi:hypothetical protein
MCGDLGSDPRKKILYDRVVLPSSVDHLQVVTPGVRISKQLIP